MKSMKLANASRPLVEYARELKEDVLILNGATGPVAALVSLKGVDHETLALSTDPAFLDLIARSRAQFAAGQTLSHEEMKRAVLPGRKRRDAERSKRTGGKRRR